MALFATILTLPLFFAADFPPFEENKINYLISKNKLDDVLTCFGDKKNSSIPPNLLQPLCYKILENSVRSDDKSEVILALYGIQCSLDDNAFYLLEEAIRSPTPEIQLTAVQVAGTFNSSASYHLLKEALTSNWLIIRLEALSLIASHKQLEHHLEAELSKVDPEVRSFFPELLALDGSEQSRKTLQRLAHDSDFEVRLQAIRALSRSMPEELYKQAKYFSHELHPACQEALVDAFLSSRDDKVSAIASQLSTSSFTRLIEAFHKSNDSFIEEEAKKDNLYAIRLLGKLKSSKASHKTLLYEKIGKQDLQVAANAAVALLELKDPYCLKMIPQLLVKDAKGLHIQTISSPGKVLEIIKVVPSCHEQFKNQPWMWSICQEVRSELLTLALELPEDEFLELARFLFETEQNELILQLTRLLSNLRSEKAIELLQEESNHLGSPFIRTAANIVLFRMGQYESSENALYDWISKSSTHSVMQLEPLLPWNLRNEKSRYNLTSEERSNLLVDAYDATAKSHKDKTVKALLQALQKGNPKNRPLIAGLLLQASN